MKDDKKELKQVAPENENNEKLSLNDDRRVKVLSPGMLVFKRFIRNKVAVAGLIMLVVMFLFSFVGALFSPYGEDQTFTTLKEIRQPIAGAEMISEYSYSKESGSLSSEEQLAAMNAISSGKTEFTVTKKVSGVNVDVDFRMEKTGDFYEIYYKDTDEFYFMVYKNSITAVNKDFNITYGFKRQAFKASESDAKPTVFTVDGVNYSIDENGMITKDGEQIAYTLNYSIHPIEPDVFFSFEFKSAVIHAIEYNELLPGNEKEFKFTEPGTDEERDYYLKYNGNQKSWELIEYRATQIYDRYSSPSANHWMGTDGYGMDMLTRLMYGGRVSLMVGFIVVIIETVIGVIFGGISGYFGGWVDNLIMRIVDIFYCIPSIPIFITLGAVMDKTNVDPTLRMIYLMIILGVFGWASVARLVRGQILSLREQEFMTATEACGISVKRRIFRHLIPNVIPQLIVTCTMGLGSTILIEATLSFLGLGVKFPFASWGNLISDVTDINVLTNYLFVWIPAGVCIVITVLAFNLVGDGLRDAFDPRMKR